MSRKNWKKSDYILARASGVDLASRTCSLCKVKKKLRYFPNKTRICFECLKEFKCTQCSIVKSFDNFLSSEQKWRSARKNKSLCWSCYKENKNNSYNKNRLKKRNQFKENLEKGLLKIDSNYLYKKMKNSSKFSSTKLVDKSSNITKDDFLNWYSKQNEQCNYCGIDHETYFVKKPIYKNNNYLKRILKFSIDRKDSTVGYVLTNIALSCPLCNYVKGFFFNEKEFKEIANQYIKPLYE